jgi:murein DD-endopeptidase MepM/ murein hydrolase activator NlpD
MVAATCPRCASVVALHEGRPFVTATGVVELWHASCFAIKDLPLIAEPVCVPIAIAVLPPRRSRMRVAVASAAGFAALAIVIASQAFADRPVVSSQVSVEVATLDEATSLRTASSEHEIVPPKPTVTQSKRLSDLFAMPVNDKDKPLDEAFASLRGWIHPITDAAELFPNNPGRHFGAHRHGVERAECGEGHCGVDLDGPRGRALVAVADGILTTVERRELGADGFSGRYVRIQHEGGTFTSYMHMEEVDAHLQVGNRVTAGQFIGTLGDTAVPNVPHLHFSLEIPNRRTGMTLFIDPASFLVRATVADTAVRKHSIKPAF